MPKKVKSETAPENVAPENAPENETKPRPLYWTGIDGIVNRTISAAIVAVADPASTPEALAAHAAALDAEIQGIKTERVLIFSGDDTSTYYRCGLIARYLGVEYTTGKFGDMRLFKVKRKAPSNG